MRGDLIDERPALFALVVAVLVAAIVIVLIG